MAQPQVLIVTPADADANNGIWRTAERWQRLLAPRASVTVARQWQGEPIDALIALHARRSADSVRRYHERHGSQGLAVVLTGTDLYHDLVQGDAAARHALQCASRLVVLQPRAVAALDPALHGRTRVILQSAERWVDPHRDPRGTQFIAVGHLRHEKDPLTLMKAARALPADSPVLILHVGRALDPVLAQAARHTAQEVSRYRWVEGLEPAAARTALAASRALVHMSRIEGGANVVIEALQSDVPVLASRIDGNLGLLGDDHPGCFEVGDALGLAALMQRLLDDSDFEVKLRAHAAARAPQFDPAREAEALAALLQDLLQR